MSVTRYEFVNFVVRANKASNPSGLKKVASIRAIVERRIFFFCSFKITIIHVFQIFNLPRCYNND